MSLPVEAKKAYGVVMAVGTKLGEKARVEPAIMDRVRATTTSEALRAEVRASAGGLLPPALLDSFDALVGDTDWLQWRARLLVQMKLSREGGKPAPGHEQGKGVGRHDH